MVDAENVTEGFLAPPAPAVTPAAERDCRGPPLPLEAARMRAASIISLGFTLPAAERERRAAVEAEEEEEEVEEEEGLAGGAEEGGGFLTGLPEGASPSSSSK